MSKLADQLGLTSIEQVEALNAQRRATRNGARRDAAIGQAAVFTPEIAGQPMLSEHEEQCALIRWRDENAAQHPGLHLLHAIPNGGQRSKAAAGKLRAEGVLAGVCDLFLPVARREFHGLYIEMKAIAGQATQAQVDFMSAVRVNGYCAALCFGWESAVKVIRWYYGENEVAAQCDRVPPLTVMI